MQKLRLADELSSHDDTMAAPLLSRDEARRILGSVLIRKLGPGKSHPVHGEVWPADEVTRLYHRLNPKPPRHK